MNFAFVCYVDRLIVLIINVIVTNVIFDNDAAASVMGIDRTINVATESQTYTQQKSKCAKKRKKINSIIPFSVFPFLEFNSIITHKYTP